MKESHPRGLIWEFTFLKNYKISGTNILGGIHFMCVDGRIFECLFGLIQTKCLYDVWNKEYVNGGFAANFRNHKTAILTSTLIQNNIIKEKTLSHRRRAIAFCV